MIDLPSILDKIQSTTHRIHGCPPLSKTSAGNLQSSPVPESPFIQGAGLTDWIHSLLSSSNAIGWVLWSEQLEIITHQSPHTATENRGWPLAAELYLPDSDTSIDLTQNGKNWIAKKITQSQAETQQTLSMQSSFLETSTAQPWPQLSELTSMKLSYEIAWSLTDTHTTPSYRPSLSRFTGFTQG